MHVRPKLLCVLDSGNAVPGIPWRVAKPLENDKLMIAVHNISPGRREVHRCRNKMRLFVATRHCGARVSFWRAYLKRVIGPRGHLTATGFDLDTIDRLRILEGIKKSRCRGQCGPSRGTPEHRIYVVEQRDQERRLGGLFESEPGRARSRSTTARTVKSR